MAQITPIVDTKKLCLSKYFIEMSQRRHKELSRSGLDNSGNLVETLYYRVEGGGGWGAKTLKTSLRILHGILFQFFAVVAVFVVCQGKL